MRVAVEYVVQGAKAAVVHVGGADGDIAQRRRAEFSDVGAVVGEVVEAEVASLAIWGIGELSGEIVDAVADEFGAMCPVGCLVDGCAPEGESAMAAGAGVGLVEEDIFAA